MDRQDLEFRSARGCLRGLAVPSGGRRLAGAGRGDGDHFDVYDGPEHELVVADQIEFLTRHLLGRPRCSS